MGCCIGRRCVVGRNLVRGTRTPQHLTLKHLTPKHLTPEYLTPGTVSPVIFFPAHLTLWVFSQFDDVKTCGSEVVKQKFAD